MNSQDLEIIVQQAKQVFSPIILCYNFEEDPKRLYVRIFELSDTDEYISNWFVSGLNNQWYSQHCNVREKLSEELHKYFDSNIILKYAGTLSPQGLASLVSAFNKTFNL